MIGRPIRPRPGSCGPNYKMYIAASKYGRFCLWMSSSVKRNLSLRHAIITHNNKIYGSSWTHNITLPYIFRVEFNLPVFVAKSESAILNTNIVYSKKEYTRDLALIGRIQKLPPRNWTSVVMLCELVYIRYTWPVTCLNIILLYS